MSAAYGGHTNVYKILAAADENYKTKSFTMTTNVIDNKLLHSTASGSTNCSFLFIRPETLCYTMPLPGGILSFVDSLFPKEQVYLQRTMYEVSSR